MAKASSIHPQFKEIEIIMTNGETFKTRSTYKKSDKLKLDIDPLTHPAWTREANYVNTKADEVSKFNDRFGGLSFLGGSSNKEEKKDEE